MTWLVGLLLFALLVLFVVYAPFWVTLGVMILTVFGLIGN